MYNNAQVNYRWTMGCQTLGAITPPHPSGSITYTDFLMIHSHYLKCIYIQIYRMHMSMYIFTLTGKNIYRQKACITYTCTWQVYQVTGASLYVNFSRRLYWRNPNSVKVTTLQISSIILIIRRIQHQQDFVSFKQGGLYLSSLSLIYQNMQQKHLHVEYLLNGIV